MGSRAGSAELIELGNRIRGRRQEMHLTQEAAAKKAGVSINTVSRIEGGQTAMSIEIFMRLVDILNADADELLNGMASAPDYDDGWCRDMLCRIQELERCEQEVVIKTIEALVEGMCRCR